MKHDISFKQAKQYGFSFPQARAWMANDSKGRVTNAAELARDAALITEPNTTVPAEFLAYIDPMVVEILTAPRRAREIFPEQKKGDWTTPYTKWRMEEVTGSTQPYTDYANGTTSGVNFEWATRQQYLFQTSITYGDLEVAMAGEAKINLASSKQRAAANVIDIDANKFALQGVANRNIYGILNDPNLPAAITAAATGTGGSTSWDNKTTVQIYNDVLALFSQLVNQTAGLIDQNTPLKLCMSPGLAVKLGGATDFNVSVLDMLNKYFSSLTIVTVPELYNATSGETMLMLADNINGTPVGFIGFGEKLMAGRVIADMSSFRQKYVSTTYGGVVLQPMAIAQMVGMG